MEIPGFRYLELRRALDLAKVVCHPRARSTLSHTTTSSDRPPSVKAFGNVAHHGEASAERFRPHGPRKSLKLRYADSTRILTSRQPRLQELRTSAHNPSSWNRSSSITLFGKDGQ